jgi:transposase-like protein
VATALKPVYTAATVEQAEQDSLREIIKNRSPFPNDEAVFRLLYLALNNIEKNGRCRSGIGSERCDNSRSCSNAECRYRKPSTGHSHKKSETFYSTFAVDLE